MIPGQASSRRCGWKAFGGVLESRAVLGIYEDDARGVLQTSELEGLESEESCGNVLDRLSFAFATTPDYILSAWEADASFVLSVHSRSSLVVKLQGRYGGQNVDALNNHISLFLRIIRRTFNRIIENCPHNLLRKYQSIRSHCW